MGYKEYIADATVTVAPNMGYLSIVLDEKGMGEKALEYCEKIVAQIKRHVDNVKYVYVEKEIAIVCEHCGYPWADKKFDYNGGCCDEDEKNNPEGKEDE